MGNFRIQLTKSAVDDLNSIPNDEREKALSAIKELSANPLLFGSNIKKLRGLKPPLYRLCAGDYRILYRVKGDMVTVLRVIDRKDLERIIKRIKL